MSTNPNERNYYVQRAETERVRAQQASDERARRAHEELAAEYAARAAAGVANDDDENVRAS